CGLLCPVGGSPYRGFMYRFVGVGGGRPRNKKNGALGRFFLTVFLDNFNYVFGFKPLLKL
ncbi:hypothetical protein ACVGV7_12180, partial [Enterobacter intestinihominis]